MLLDVDLTVILPIRVTKERIETIEHIQNIKLDNNIPSNVSFLIVDDGSEEIYSKDIKNKSQEVNAKYLYLNSSSKPFSLARARNQGAKSAKSKFIMFQDIDILPYNGFYRDIIQEIKVQEIEKRVNSFLIIGVIYLSKYASINYNSFSKQYLLDKAIIGDKKYVERYSTATSITLLHKEHFDSIGGYDEKFEKWGHEDIDLNCRLILQDNLAKLPKEFILDEKNFNNIFEYKGWKSIYRLYGDRVFFKGIVLFHYWHSTKQNSNYYANKEKNKKYFHTKLQKYIENYIEKRSYKLTKESILFDRYKYSLSPSNRLKCKSILYSIYYKIRKIM